jgi:very-short-patch-repair endonuclease
MLILIALLIVVAVIVAVVARPQGRNSSPYQYAAKPLLTPNEKEFFERLQTAVPEYFVQSQVAMGALMTGRHAQGKHQATRSTFDRKIVDYVLLDDNLDVVLLVELDDRTHDSAKDASRDAMTSQAGYRTLRVESRAKPSVPELRALTLRAIESAPRRQKR